MQELENSRKRREDVSSWQWQSRLCQVRADERDRYYGLHDYLP